MHHRLQLIAPFKRRLSKGLGMVTRINYMAALKSAWKRAPSAPEKAAAQQKYEGAKQSNAARIEKAATAHALKVKMSAIDLPCRKK
jgi:hypothetical protein